MSETIQLINTSISRKQKLSHVVVNAAKIIAIQHDRVLAESVNNCDVINADGQAVVWASRFLNQPLKERVSGIDIMEEVVRISYLNKYKIYFLGGTKEVVQEVVGRYSNSYSKDIVAGYRDGYFEKEEEKQIARDISLSQANVLFVAISSPKKENFLFDNREILNNVEFTMGVGGSFDVVAGKVRRAPKWMQNMGLEWFYRFIQEPRRMWKRYLIGNTKFILLVLKEKFKFSKVL